MVKPGTIRTKNPGWLKRLILRYKDEDVLAIGWPSGPAAGIAYPDGTQVALVAAVNNFGSASRGIPARPFMSQGATDAVQATEGIRRTLVPKLNQGKITKAQILEHMGPFAAGAVKKRIKTGPWEPNAPRTVAEKGSAAPLRDTGLMQQSLTYVVRKNR